MVSPTPPTDIPPDTILFRPSKKRKIYRQRAALEDDASRPTTAPSAASVPQSIDELIADAAVDDLEGTAVSMAEILRLRKQKKRVGGVEFRALESVRDEGGTLVLRERAGAAGEHGGAAEEGASRVVRRFAPQTGIGGGTGDVDRHMTAYIDFELSKRLQSSQAAAHLLDQSPGQNQSGSSASHHNPRDLRLDSERESRKEKDVQRQPATLGKLQEIDLGDEARSRNVAQTERARRRLDGEVTDDEGPSKPTKVRLGPDGKPWRGRKRRASEDVKRDKLVEDVLRENRLEIYDELPVESSTINDDQAADDRIAEEFRREFLDAVSQRQRKKAGPVPPPARGPGGKKTEEELMKGPKLGGSRSARAAMRETILKQQGLKK